MPVKPCASQPFEGTQQFEVPYGTTIIQLEKFTHGLITDWTMTVCRRPVVPVWGVALNMASGTYDFLPSTKGQEQTLINIAIASFNASVNYVNNNSLLPDQYIDGQYPDYLYRKIFSDSCLFNRYLEVYNKSAQFFRLHAAIPAFTSAIYNELTDLTTKIMRESDKQMFIPPGKFAFNSGSVAATSLTAWSVADPTFERLYGIELITT